MTIYKDNLDTKLGVTFYRRDPQEGSSESSAIVSRLTDPTSPAFGQLAVGDRILEVAGCPVDGPLTAARALRGSAGYIKIKKLDKRPDFDANYDKYAEIEAENARRAMEQALPGQPGLRTPRTDAATPRGPGGSGNTPLLTGLKVINGPGTGTPGGAGAAAPPLGLNMQTLNMDNVGQTLQHQWGQLSARTMSFFEKVGDAIPTEDNRKKKAALRIQKVFKAWVARGHFHEERGAVLMLQAAARRKRAQDEKEYKKALIDWAAITIQVAYKKHSATNHKKKVAAKKKELKAARQAKSGGGVLGKLSRSLSFSKRSAKTPKENATPRGTTDDGGTTASSSTSSEASPNANAPAAAPAAEPQKRRSLSFMRRKQKAAATGDEAREVQNV